ncbi:MAG: DUF1501 domain-containing protein [Betaproteobacteria bacterium]|nr:MAG: DUF1501 domain-containing protein [Betaproteobacteria bacterium]
MNRRQFIGSMVSAPIVLFPLAARVAQAHPANYRNLLVLIELKGGNDGLNTVVPYAAESYYALRPRLAIARDQVIQLDEHTGLHPALKPLGAMWQAQELAIVQGLGYPSANLSHFRSIEIWHTASRADEYLEDGWLSRVFKRAPAPAGYAADGVVVGSHDLGPLAGVGPRVIALANTERFLRQMHLANPVERGGSAALRHIMRVERDIAKAASRFDARHQFRTEFPATAFGNAVRTASQVIASRSGVAVVKLTLDGFDTHSNQAARHVRLLQSFADGLVALRQALTELGRWESSLVMTYAEFGRRPKQNLSGGTDHGTASAHFLAGGRVRGGLHGLAPALDRLDGNGNLPFGPDFRELYAMVLERWWGVDSSVPLKGRFEPLELLKV